MSKCFIWAVVIQIVATFLLWIASSIPGIGIIFMSIFIYYYSLPWLVGMEVYRSIYTEDAVVFGLLVAALQILLVSYLFCRIRFWLKKRREGQVGE